MDLALAIAPTEGDLGLLLKVVEGIRRAGRWAGAGRETCGYTYEEGPVAFHGLHLRALIHLSPLTPAAG